MLDYEFFLEDARHLIGIAASLVPIVGLLFLNLIIGYLRKKVSLNLWESSERLRKRTYALKRRGASEGKIALAEFAPLSTLLTICAFVVVYLGVRDLLGWVPALPYFDGRDPDLPTADDLRNSIAFWVSLSCLVSFWQLRQGLKSDAQERYLSIIIDETRSRLQSMYWHLDADKRSAFLDSVERRIDEFGDESSELFQSYRAMEIGWDPERLEIRARVDALLAVAAKCPTQQ